MLRASGATTAGADCPLDRRSASDLVGRKDLTPK
jgi:hypothetical protein